MPIYDYFTLDNYYDKHDHNHCCCSSCVCAITHHSYVQSIVLEPCWRLIVQNNEAFDPLRWSVDAAASTGDVVCRLFSTTVTAVVREQSPAQHVCPKSANTSPYSVTCLAGSRHVQTTAIEGQVTTAAHQLGLILQLNNHCLQE